MALILHLEGYLPWMDLCREAYRQAGVPFCIFPVAEAQQAAFLSDMLPRCRPSFLALTGHDRTEAATSAHTADFIRAVTAARRWEPDPDSLFIFAGACGSDAAAIQKAGANFASSPGRIPISVLDPVRLLLAASSCPPGERIHPSRLIAATLCGSAGIAGSPCRAPFPYESRSPCSFSSTCRASSSLLPRTPK